MSTDLSPLWISLRTALFATLLVFCAGIAAARWMLTYGGRGRSVIDGIFTLPLVLPPTVVGFVLLLLLGKNSPLGQMLRQMGLNIIFTWYAAVLAATVVAFPLMYKTALGAFEQIDKDILYCARTLGASEWRIFWQVMLPLAWPGLVAGTILSFARALGEFGATLMVAGNIPGVTQTVPMAIFFASEAGHMREALAWVLLMVAVSLGITVLIHYGAEPQAQKRTTTPPGSLRMMFCRLLRWGRLKASLGDRAASKSFLPTDTLSPPWMSPTPHFLFAASSLTEPELPSRLEVDICKRLPGFTLTTAFETNGSPLGLLGASGSGKSMTLRCIAGLDTPTEGRIVLNQRVLFDSQRGINVPSAKRRVGVVFQHYALFPHLTVVQNIAFGIQSLPRTERSHRIYHCLDLLQLEGLEQRYPHQLSGGQQQRVALARALAIAPDALLLDEPLSALDTYLRSQIEELLARILGTYRGAVLFVTHNLEEVYRVCPNLMVMDQGRAIATGSKYAIFEHPQHARVAQITGCKNFSRAVAHGVHQVEALDWGCLLDTVEPVPDRLTQVGVRAHQLRFLDPADHSPSVGQASTLPNVFPCWLVRASETQHRMTLYLKLHTPPETAHDYHLQAEVLKEKWDALKQQPYPWAVQIDPIRTMLLTH